MGRGGVLLDDTAGRRTRGPGASARRRLRRYGSSGVAHDSRRVRRRRPVLLPAGRARRRPRFAAAAVDGGRQPRCSSSARSTSPSPQVVVDDTRAAMAPLAAAFYGHPSAAMTVVGVTGTNGKTTTTHLLAVDLRARRAGRAACIGTLTGAHTTPEAPELQAALAGVPRRGQAGRRDGGVVARARRSTASTAPVRRRRVHQPRSATTSTSTARSSATSRPRPACSTRRWPRSAWSTPTTRTAACCSTPAPIPMTRYSLADAADLVVGSAGVDVPRGGASRSRCRSAVGSTSPTRSPPRPRGGRSASATAVVAAGLAAAAPVPGPLRAGRRRPAVRRGRRLRPHARRPGVGARARPARWPAAAG